MEASDATLALFGQFLRLILRSSPKSREKCLEALRDSYGDKLCLSACYRDAEPGIRRAKVLASKTTSVPGGGK